MRRSPPADSFICTKCKKKVTYSVYFGYADRDGWLICKDGRDHERPEVDIVAARRNTKKYIAKVIKENKPKPQPRLPAMSPEVKKAIRQLNGCITTIHIDDGRGGYGEPVIDTKKARKVLEELVDNYHI
jgi:hypothetical protein